MTNARNLRHLIQEIPTCWYFLPDASSFASQWNIGFNVGLFCVNPQGEHITLPIATCWHLKCTPMQMFGIWLCWVTFSLGRGLACQFHVVCFHFPHTVNQRERHFWWNNIPPVLHRFSETHFMGFRKPV